MWQMYSVFEELFGLQKVSSKPVLKPVVVGDKIKQKIAQDTTPSTNKDTDNVLDTKESAVIAESAAVTISSCAVVTTSANNIDTTAANTVVSCSISTTATANNSSPSTVSSNSDVLLVKQPSPMDKQIPVNKIQSYSPTISHNETKVSETTQCPTQSTTLPSTPLTMCDTVPSNPLLDTIGVLTGSNADSDDSDLDVVYQQLRYNRGHHRRPEQSRIRTHRSQRHHHHQHFANSDPESTSYAGSNSIDSGYKSQCATPEVSDTLSAPEVRRSASDVSASDSSTTSGHLRSADDSKSAKIKMGTRVMAGKSGQGPRVSRRHSPLLESSMRDVTLDHLMYLRQSLRKDRQDYLPSSSQGSIPSSSASSTVRDELSPSIMTDEESSWSAEKPRISCQDSATIQHTSPLSYSPVEASFFKQGARRGRRLSAGNEIPPETRNRGSSSEFLLSGMEYYDLDSIQGLPQSRGYVAMVEEKTRCSRIHLIPASKRDITERRIDSLYKKKKDQLRIQHSSLDPSVYGLQQPSVGSSRDLTYRQPQSDSKLTEAAIRVLEMIEDFRMEEAIEHAAIFNKDPRGKVRPNISPTSVGPHAFVPRFRKTSTSRSRSRPASTGSLIGAELVQTDSRSVGSSSASYAASAEHHVYEEIMYDLVCERARGEQQQQQQLLPMSMNARSRILPASPLSSASSSRNYMSEHVRVQPRSHKHKGNLYAMVADHDSRNADRILDMEWHRLRSHHRDNLPPDYPV